MSAEFFRLRRISAGFMDYIAAASSAAAAGSQKINP